MILLQKEIFTAIRNFFGPDIIAVHILASSVQMYRDHEDTVRELWWCGRAATEWLGDRTIARVTREIEARERARDRARYWRRMLNPESPPSPSETSSANDEGDVRYGSPRL